MDRRRTPTAMLVQIKILLNLLDRLVHFLLSPSPHLATSFAQCLLIDRPKALVITERLRPGGRAAGSNVSLDRSEPLVPKVVLLSINQG